MTPENKIALVIRDDLQSWQKLNVASFLASAVAIQFPETHGEKFVNASGSEYLPFIKHPILIYKADSSPEIQRALERAKARELGVGIYPESLFATKTRRRIMWKSPNCPTKIRFWSESLSTAKAKK